MLNGDTTPVQIARFNPEFEFPSRICPASRIEPLMSRTRWVSVGPIHARGTVFNSRKSFSSIKADTPTAAVSKAPAFEDSNIVVLSEPVGSNFAHAEGKLADSAP